jgi:beta-glucosidase
MERDILQDLLAKLTLKEKVSLLSGADGWQTQEISRLVIGSLKVSASSIALSQADIS